MRTLSAYLPILSLWLGLTLRLGAAEWYVAPNGTDTGTGTSPADPWATLTNAVVKANSNDTIHVAAGTYTEREIYARKNLAILGAGVDLTFVQAATAPNTATNRVFRFRSGYTFTLADLTVRHGRTLTESGGGIRNDGTLRLTRVTVIGNSAVGAGGGIRSQDGTLTLDNCRIADNSATNNGGGIEVYLGLLTASNTILSGNHSAGFGGGFFNNGGTGVFTYSAITSNSTANNGGGLAFTSDLVISNCTIGYNTAALSGGGLYNNHATGQVWNSTFVGNSAAGGNLYGGGGIANEGPLWLSNCTISLNSANQDGGGIRNNITNITLWVLNCTITGNSAGNRGGGIDSTQAEPIRIKHTILGANSAALNPDTCAVYMSEDYNLIQDTSGATLYGANAHNVTGQNPLLGPLQNNGGPTWTQAPGTASPALDTGDPAFTDPLATDQRGAPRVQNGRIDIGAYERLEADQDGDGMDGQWEFCHGLCPTNASDRNQNPDGDAFDNFAEYTADTDPRDGNSFWHLESIAATHPVGIGFLSSAGRVYDLQWNTNLNPLAWYGVSARTNISGNGGLAVITDTNAMGLQRYYRVQVRVH